MTDGRHVFEPRYSPAICACCSCALCISAMRTRPAGSGCRPRDRLSRPGLDASPAFSRVATAKTPSTTWGMSISCERWPQTLGRQSWCRAARLDRPHGRSCTKFRLAAALLPGRRSPERLPSLPRRPALSQSTAASQQGSSSEHSLLSCRSSVLQGRSLAAALVIRSSPAARSCYAAAWPPRQRSRGTGHTASWLTLDGTARTLKQCAFGRLNRAEAARANAASRRNADRPKPSE